MSQNKELIDYVNKSLSEGMSYGEIRENLLSAGWKVEDVDVVLSNITGAYGGVGLKPGVSSQKQRNHVYESVPETSERLLGNNIKYLNYLMLSLLFTGVGFGFCAYYESASSFKLIKLFLSIISYLVSIVFAVLSIVDVNRVVGKKYGLASRIVVTLLALILIFLSLALGSLPVGWMF